MELTEKQLEKMKSAEELFRWLEGRGELIDLGWKYIVANVQIATSKHDPDILIDLDNFITDGEGMYARKAVAEVLRIQRICKIVSLEKENGMHLFMEGCDNYEALMGKYMLTLYSIRRLFFRLSEDSIEEAKTFLKSNSISSIAIYMIIREDLTGADGKCLRFIMDSLYSGWSDLDKSLFESVFAVE